MREWRVFAIYDVFTESEWMTTCDMEVKKQELLAIQILNDQTNNRDSLVYYI